MSENLTLWNEFADIDPKFTKPITGKTYKGTSPNPQYVIMCLTELFGPVGIGFGWRVVAEEFIPLGPKTLHWCRIEFWHTKRENTYESYGQTLAAYPTSGGSFMVDEDAPKKSLTDAIIKAASHVGIAANIFLGRWDDQKHVAEVNSEYRRDEKKSSTSQDAVNDKSAPEYDPSPAIAAIEASKTGRELLAALDAKNCRNENPAIAAARVNQISLLVKGSQSVAALDAFAKAFSPDWSAVKADADMRRSELSGNNADLGGDTLPY